MPALTIPSPTNTLSISPTQSPLNPEKHDAVRSRSRSRSRSQSQSRSHSPDRPPISPLTPTASAAQLPAPDPPTSPSHILPPPLTSTFRSQPPPVPISESENPDAIALRSAISLLQLQREKSKRDLKALQDLKSAAVSDPQGFVRSLQDQRSRPSNSAIDALAPTISGSAGLVSGEQTVDGQGNDGASRDALKQDSHAQREGDSITSFPSIPEPQNIIRCPPVNWAKYHVVGEPLDKLHEEQKRWPGSNEPPRTGAGTRAPPHAVAAPYSPYTDGVTGPPRAQQSRDSRKSHS